MCLLRYLEGTEKITFNQIRKNERKIELCHGQTCPKIFVVVIPKEGLAGGAHDADYKIILCCRCQQKILTQEWTTFDQKTINGGMNG